jgi:carbonic anhydrase
MVAHMVHRAADGKLAVVAVLLEAGATESPLVRTLWEHLPNTKEIELVVPELMINAADLLPANRAYYTYTGSLTTPPCSEGVTWFVMRHPAGVSADQVARFGKLYPKNARPVQPQNGRAIRSGG